MSLSLLLSCIPYILLVLHHAVYHIIHLLICMLHPRDDPSTYNIAVLLVHESELAKQRRHLEMEQQLIADLETQLKTTHSPVAEAELIMHEV